MSEDSSSLFLGRLAVERGLITEERLRDALAEQRREEQARGTERRRLGQILVERGFLTELQLTSLLTEQRVRRAETTISATPATVPSPDEKKTSTVFQSQPFGKYTLLKKLGRGGMGVVFEALDPVLNRRVAIKTLIPASYATPEDAMRDEERFLREAQLAAGLAKHPNIVGVYEAGVIDGKRYLAMEFVDGVQMQDWRKARPVSIARQIRLLRDVVLAVHHAHENGVVHRDLKPANILVDFKDTPHVTDFGLAKSRGKELTGALTDPGIAIGTPAYMSPEQAQGLKSVDRRSDIYSLGVLLFEILTDRVPFVAETGIQMLVQIIEHPVPRPSTLVPAPDHPSHDPVLETICMKALAKSPAARYPTAQELADDLTRWLEPKPAPLLKPAPERPSRALAAGVAAVVLAGALFLILRPPPAPAPVVEPPPAAAEEKPRVLDHPDRVNAVAYAPKGGLLAAGCADGTVKLWEAATGKAVADLAPHAGKVENLAFSPDGTTLAVVTEDAEEGSRPGEIKLWDVGRREAVGRLSGHATGINAVAFAPVGGILLTGDQSAVVKAWDVAARREVWSHGAHQAPIRAIAFSPDGKRFATGSWDRTVKLWEREGFAMRAQLEGHQQGVWGLSFSPDGRWVASASSDRTIRLWDVEKTGECRTFRGHQNEVQSVSFSPCGKRLASVSRDRTVKVWDVAKGEEVSTLRGHSDFVWTVAFAPDGTRVASGGFDRKVALWPVPPPGARGH